MSFDKIQKEKQESATIEVDEAYNL